MGCSDYSTSAVSRDDDHSIRFPRDLSADQQRSRSIRCDPLKSLQHWSFERNDDRIASDGDLLLPLGWKHLRGRVWYSLCRRRIQFDFSTRLPKHPDRVTGAIGSDGPPISTLSTNNGNVATDIPQDFSISSIGEYPMGPFTTVTIPNGANYLFFGVNDSYYGDNYSTDLALHIAPVPEPATLLLLAAGGPVIAGLRRKITSQST